ncbi:FAD-dependent urate hydroxylase [Actinomadura rubteroloni]|uniref:FAD-dependent urate hydroxylase n=1 Tax=Actinomadura rubteroloni TaxID=1926885 RepID=A0A2P4UIB3_9ACTN|nr:FAD-dependent monooxygenase [Actinomadura rubteroloni]POM24805.1 FAD-dependent urate hydroxylase [Actinomadura rubteroloni]
MTTIGRALVIGGGIAGPVTAMALRKAGIDATVHEAYTGTADGVGGTLSVAPNGLDALRAVNADLSGVGQPITRSVLADGTGRPITVLDGLPDLPPSRALWRSDLFRALHDRAVAQGVEIRHGRRLVGVEESATGITARFADGTAETADLLVGADGIRSTVRTLIDPDAPAPRHVPLLNFGGLADVAVPSDTDTAVFAFGSRGFLGYWLQPDGRTAWFANVPHAEPLTGADARRTSPAHWLERLRDLYADDRPGRDLVRHTAPEDLVAFGTVEIMPSVPHWHRGRMVLVGDAVHAPSPSSGQGASLAAESGVQLARCLRDLPDVPSALARYEALRRPRVERVAARAARTNRTKTLGPAALRMMRLMTPLLTRTVLTPEKALAPEHRHHIDWDAKVG